MLGKQTVPIVLGVGTSVAGSFAYTWLTSNQLPLWWVAAAATVSLLVIWAYILLRRPISIVSHSGIVQYYPTGQAGYQNDLIQDAARSRKIVVCGARGRDLIGEESPLAKVLQERKPTFNMEVFLIDPDSQHIRLRMNSLNAEKSKYKSERNAVDSFLEVLNDRNGLNIIRYSYSSLPLFRAIIFDDIAYICIYEDGIRGRDLPCYKITKRCGPLWNRLEKYIDQLRDEATSLSSDIQA